MWCNGTRRCFERGAQGCGDDFLAHPFWDKYIKYEETQEAYDRMLKILLRIIYIPMHQYARYFESYTQLCAARPLEEFMDTKDIEQIKAELDAEQEGEERSELQMEQLMRNRASEWQMRIYSATQAETNKRWVYEAEASRSLLIDMW
jgi:pre-mRNA-processing factor 39